MSAASVAQQALLDPKQFYDARYAQGYMQDFSDMYEACRLYTVRAILRTLRRTGFSPRRALDYGCGEGRYLRVWRGLFPDCALTACDISDQAMRHAGRVVRDVTFVPMSDEGVSLDGEQFDLVTSIEVLEHVRDADRAVGEIARLLRPGGLLLLTTPSANRYSLEWLVNRARGGLLPSFDGYGRFATDEPGHLRRLDDAQLTALLRRHGLSPQRVLHRAHVFTPLAARLASRLRWLPAAVWTQLALLDWHLLRWLPNGATVLVVARRDPAQRASGPPQTV
jgi:SAM-dependent methyltransferase